MHWQPIADHNEWPNTVHNNSSLSFELVGTIEIIEKLLRSNKFIICFAYFVLLKYSYNWENIAILTTNSRRAWHVIPAQEVNREAKTKHRYCAFPVNFEFYEEIVETIIVDNLYCKIVAKLR